MKSRLVSFRLMEFCTLAVIVLLSFSLVYAQQTRELTQDNEDGKSLKRTALVIGNSDYAVARKLANPSNDATDMANSLRELGFDVVSGTNLNLKQMNDKVREFGDRLKANGGVGLFYYAGHGIQVNGRNYLVPVDAAIPREDEVDFNALNLDQILRKMATANNGLNIVVLDACRNNPFARSWSRGEDEGGLAQISAPTGTFIAYATSPDRTASDGDGRNGLYTAELLKIMKQPNMKIEETFKEVRKSVSKISGGKQIPWDSSSLSGDFYFRQGQPNSTETKIVAKTPAVTNAGETSSSKPEVQSSVPKSPKSEVVSPASGAISGGVLNGKAINLVKPPYPPAARAVRAGGAVNVQVTINEQGNVISAEAVSGHPLLKTAAVQAAKASKFSQTFIKGQAVKVTGVIVYNFTAPD